MRRRGPFIAETMAAATGAALLIGAMLANQRWLDRHFLPGFFITRAELVASEVAGRIVVAALGAALAWWVRPRLGRLVERVPAQALLIGTGRIALAVALALGISELVLRATFRRSSEEQPASEVPWRRRDARLGWAFIPSRTEQATVGGRRIEYAFDASGYRVRSVATPVDPQRPVIVFTGESAMVGQGLNWEETVPAQVEKLTGIESANIAVHGFATDQAYMRLSAELPRFKHVAGVVMLFAPGLFDRNLDDDRPHLGPRLEWLAGKPRWRLAILAGWVVPYRSDAAIERGIEATRTVLLATATLARARGAVPLIVVPHFAPEQPAEPKLRRRILDESGVPYVWAELDPSWRIPGDRHPDALSARVIASAIASYFQ